jgi:hypothetical protein
VKKWWPAVVTVTFLIILSGCSIKPPITQEKILNSWLYQRLAENKKLLCSNSDYATEYVKYNPLLHHEMSTELTDLSGQFKEDGLFSKRLIGLDGPSKIKFSAAVWWENCKKKSYWKEETHTKKITDPITGEITETSSTERVYYPACRAFYELPDNKGYGEYYPNDTIKLTSGARSSSGDTVSEIFYIPAEVSEYPQTFLPFGPGTDLGNLLPKAGDLSLKNYSGPSILPVFVNKNSYRVKEQSRVKIPGDFRDNNYSALAAIKNLTCLEALQIPSVSAQGSSINQGGNVGGYGSYSWMPYADSAAAGFEVSQKLIYTFTPKVNLFPISALSKLRILTIGNVQAVDNFGHVDFSALKPLENIQILSMSSTNATELDVVENLHNLLWLDVSGNDLDSISATLWFKKLRYLFADCLKSPVGLDFTASLAPNMNDQLEVKDLPFPQMNTVSFRGSPLTSIRSFLYSAKLKAVDLRESGPGCLRLPSGTSSLLPALDISPLFNLKQLSTLKLSGRGVTTEDCDQLKEDLPGADITCTGTLPKD